MAPDESPDQRRQSSARLPAGLEQTGRDESLVSGPDAHPTGTRADRRHSVPGTMIPGGPQPAAAEGEAERVREGAESTPKTDG
jgi:hypothetical protein